MLSRLLTILFFVLRYALALDEDQIFQSDWQTVNIGVPSTSLQIEDQLITFSDKGVLSIINATTGDVLNRFQNEDADKIVTSGMNKINNTQILTYFNYDNAFLSSKIIIWNMIKPYGIVDREYSVNGKIIAVAANSDSTVIVTEDSVMFANDGNIDVIHESEKLFDKAKVFSSCLDDDFYILVESNGEILFSSVNVFKLEKEKTLSTYCSSLDHVRHHNSSKNVLICKDKYAFEFDGNTITKVNEKSNLITEKLSTDSLIHGYINDFHVLEDYVIIDSEGALNLFNYRNTSLTPSLVVQSPLEKEKNIVHFSHTVYDNSTKIGTFTVNELEELNYYINGELTWSKDQSFSNITDAVFIDDRSYEEFAENEQRAEASSNFIIALFLKLNYFYHELFGNGKKSLDDSVIFGMDKKMVVLTSNNKIGIYNLIKERDVMQLKKIFKPFQTVDKLHEINNKVYAESGDNLYYIDLESHVLTPVSEGNIFSMQLSQMGLSESTTGFSAIWEPDRNRIKGFKIGDDKTETFVFYPEENTDIISYERRSYSNNLVAQNGVILPGRSVLYKYLVPNLGVATLFDKVNHLIKINLINLITGEVYGSFSKSVGNGFDPSNLNLAFEENFIIFSIPDMKNEIDTQIWVIDLFESLKPNEKITKGMKSYSAFANDPLLPAFAYQVFTIPGTSIRSLAISKTKSNIAIKDIIVSTSTGQVVVIPKWILDGRRGGYVGDFKSNSTRETIIKIDEMIINKNSKIENIEYTDVISSKVKYTPVINVSSPATLTHYRKILSNMSKRKPILKTVPTNLESTTYVVLIDGDIFVTILRPSGSFDKLTSSFKTKVLISTIVILLIAMMILYPREQRGKTLAMWGL